MVLSIGMFSACNEDVSVDSIYITAAENTPTTNFSAKKTGDALGITISSALIAKSDIEGELLVENALVANYNSAHGEDYQSLPNGVCELSDTHVKIVNGNYRSEAVKLVVKDIEALKKGVNYLVPIRLVSNAKRYPVLPGSDVLYVVINRTLLMNVPKFNGENYFKVNFKDNDVSKFQNLDAFTIEARVSMWKFPKYYGGNLMGIIGFPESENIEKSAWLFVDGTPDRVGGAGNVPVFMPVTWASRWQRTSGIMSQEYFPTTNCCSILMVSCLQKPSIKRKFHSLKTSILVLHQACKTASS